MARIIVTVGPASIDAQTLKLLLESGANSFRINLSHSTHEALDFYIQRLKSVGITPSIDTQGAQLRISHCSFDQKLIFGDLVNVHFEGSPVHLEDSSCHIILNHQEVIEQINVGDVLKVDFNGLALEVIERTGVKSISTRVVSAGKALKNRAVDVVGKPLLMSVLTEFDKEAIAFALGHGISEFYASFVSSSDDAIEVRKHIGEDSLLVSKIETSRSLSNLSSILNHTDQILIDRGDLSREISIPFVPMAVFSAIELAKTANIPVNIATNVLDAMMTSPLPSRAEVSDIYNHLMAGASGMVLAAEVAIGSNPVATVAFLKYLIDCYSNHRNGLHGLGSVGKPPVELVGRELLNWL